MRFLILAFLSFSAFAADSVSLTQKGNTVTVTATVDGAAMVAEYTKNAADIETQRTNRIAKGENATEVNATLDAQLASLKRSTQLKFFDAAIKALQAAQNRAAISDVDAAAQVAAAKAKIDAEQAKADALKPTVDADITKDK